MSDLCSSVVSCVNDFQTLISGVLAVGAALIGGAYVLHSSRLPVEAQRKQIETIDRRKASYVARVLSSDFARVGELAVQAASTITVVISANKEITEATRAKTIIDLHPIVDDIEAMSLLPDDLAQAALEVRRRLHKHNFDMRTAGGSFGDSNFQQHVKNQAKSLSQQARSAGQAFLQHSERLALQARSG